MAERWHDTNETLDTNDASEINDQKKGDFVAKMGF